MTKDTTEQTEQHYCKNRENYEQLRSWLLEGAATVEFDMNYALRYGSEEGTGSCGTACCIAGAALQMNRGIFGMPLLSIPDDVWDDISYAVSKEDVVDGEDVVSWDSTAKEAIEFLGVDVDGLPDQKDDSYILDLFSSEQAPDGCTPEQAAQALENFDLTGDPMWDTV